MQIDLNNVTVENNPAEERFEAKVGDYVAFAAYQRSGSNILFTHTEVPPALQGQGLAGKIVRTALDEARTQQLGVVPLCSYVANYIRKHPEYRDLVSTPFRDQ